MTFLMVKNLKTFFHKWESFPKKGSCIHERISRKTYFPIPSNFPCNKMFDKTKQSFTYRDDLKTFENSSCKQRRFVNESKVVVVFLLFVIHGFLHFSIVHCFFKRFLICMKMNFGLFEIGQIIGRGANSVRTTGLRRSFYVKPIFS